MNPSPGRQSPSSLVVSELPVNRVQLAAPVLRAGIVPVYSRADGTVVDLGRRLSFMEALSGDFRTMYEVDVSRQETQLSASGNELPTRDDRFSFDASVTVEWHVSQPDIVVREGVRDGRAIVARRVLFLIRGISRRYQITECEDVEREINELHRGGSIAIREHGLAIDHISAFVTLDSSARQYLQQQETIERERDLGRRSHGRNVEALRNEQDLERQRMEAVMSGVQGELGLIAIHLRHHPDESLQVLQMMHARQQELEQRQQARFASSDEIFTKMMDAGLVQAADVEEIRRQVLQNTLAMVGGAANPPAQVGPPTALPSQPAVVQPPQASPAQVPPSSQPAKSSPPAPATRPAPAVRARGGASGAAPASAPAPDPNGVGGWRPRKTPQNGSDAS